MRVIDHIRAATSLLATGLPWLERTYQVLPVTQRVREDALSAAMLATLLCVIVGYATARYSAQGLQVGWTALVLFLAVLVALFGFMDDLLPRADRALLHSVLRALWPEYRFLSLAATRRRRARYRLVTAFPRDRRRKSVVLTCRRVTARRGRTKT